MRTLRGPFIRSVFFILGLALAGCAGGSSAAPAGPSSAAGMPAQFVPSPSPLSNVGYMTPGESGASGSLAPGAASAVLVGISTNTAIIGSTSGGELAAAPIAVAVSATSSAAKLLRPASHPAPIDIDLPEQFAASGPDFDRALQSDLISAQGRPETGARLRAHLPASVGASAALWAQGAANGRPSGSYLALPATLAAVTPHGYIWIDNALASLIADAASVAAIASDFEIAYASDVRHFASPDYPQSAGGLRAQYASCDDQGNSLGASAPMFVADSDPRIHLFVVDPASLGSGVGGYFDSANYYNQGTLNCTAAGRRFKSNEAPFIYVGWNTTQSVAFQLKENILRGSAHELQHLISFVNHVIEGNGSNAVSEDVWLNEGFSMLAQDFAVNAAFGSVPTDGADAAVRAYNYLLEPQSVSVTGFIGRSGDSLHYNCSSCYGGVYLFARYLYDRFGGDSFSRTIDRAGAPVSLENLQAVTGQAAGALLGDFAIALQNSGTGNSSDPRFNFQSLNLRGAVRDQFGASLNFNGPSPIATLSSGGGATYVNYLGANFYIALHGAAGSNVSLHDGSGGAYALAGAIWQR